MIIQTTNSLTAVVVLSLWMLTAAAFKDPILNVSKDNANKALMDTIPGDTTVAGDKVFEAVDEEAYFPGKEDGWRSFLEQNLNPTTPVDNGAPAGTYTIYIQFVVDLNGKLSEIKALTKHGYGMEAEVMRILRKSPPWIPAVQDGKPVRAYRKQPVTFQVMEDKKKKRRKN
jgi:periplasmic protein TonB